MSVRVDGPGMEKTASSIDDNMDEFKTLYEEIITRVNNDLDADFTQDGKAWTGNKAKQFKDNFKKVDPDFKVAETNIRNKATDLRGHAQTWTNFEA